MKAWFYVANSRATRKKCNFPKLFLNAGQLAPKNRKVARGNGPVQMITPTTAANR
jgi:hypothetical protein